MTVYIPEFQLSKKTRLGLVSLKVKDLDKMVDFYVHIIGLKLLEQKKDSAILGVDGTQLLQLRKIDQPNLRERKTGLYHLAFLLPNRTALGKVLLHYLQTKAPIEGASDHGYSEALYLTDPEGNGIEVYCDKPMDVWDIRSDGEIVGVTLPLEAEGLLALAENKSAGFPIGTKMGHVHLTVADLEKTERFYTDVIGSMLKNNYGAQAKFFAFGDYHHHIGTNIWGGRGLPAMDEKDLGLDYFSIIVPDKTELNRLKTHLELLGIDEMQMEEECVRLMDPNGIQVMIKVENQVDE